LITAITIITMKFSTYALVLALSAGTTSAFLPSQQSLHSPAFLATSTIGTSVVALREQIVSPFDESGAATADSPSETETATKPKSVADIIGPLDLTWDNVELVLDSMRDFLIQDGGNVLISEIDGPVVKLELVVCYIMFIHSIVWCGLV
jgi:hypothetical protein